LKNKKCEKQELSQTNHCHKQELSQTRIVTNKHCHVLYSIAQVCTIDLRPNVNVKAAGALWAADNVHSTTFPHTSSTVAWDARSLPRVATEGGVAIGVQVQLVVVERNGANMSQL
jgi:hypothetical protein